MPLMKRVRVLAAKVETTIGTAISLSGSDGSFNAWDVVIQPAIGMDMREAQGSMDHLSAVPGTRAGKATFKTDIGWDSTSTDPSWASVLLPACGWVGASGVYNPKSEAPGSNVKTLTIGCYFDGTLRSIAGAVGTWKLVLPTGKMAYIEWEFTGVWQPPTDASILAPTYPPAKPLRWAAASACSYNSVVMKTESITIDAGNEVVLREDPTKDAGYISALITDRRPTIKANPETNLVATQDRFGYWIAGSEYAIALTLSGPVVATTAGTLAISAPKAQIMNIQEADRNKMVVDDIEFECNKNGTTKDQSLTLTFTAGT